MHNFESVKDGVAGQIWDHVGNQLYEQGFNLISFHIWNQIGKQVMNRILHQHPIWPIWAQLDE